MYTDIALEFHVKLNLNHLHARLNTITKEIHRNHRILITKRIFETIESSTNPAKSKLK